jgi:predicted RNA-binding protein with TRAM domain
MKENQEAEAVIDSCGGKGDGVAGIQSCLMFVPRSKMRGLNMARIRSVDEALALAEGIA